MFPIVYQSGIEIYFIYYFSTNNCTEAPKSTTITNACKLYNTANEKKSLEHLYFEIEEKEKTILSQRR